MSYFDFTVNYPCELWGLYNNTSLSSSWADWKVGSSTQLLTISGQAIETILECAVTLECPCTINTNSSAVAGFKVRFTDLASNEWIDISTWQGVGGNGTEYRIEVTSSDGSEEFHPSSGSIYWWPDVTLEVYEDGTFRAETVLSYVSSTAFFTPGGAIKTEVFLNTASLSVSNYYWFLRGELNPSDQAFNATRIDLNPVSMSGEIIGPCIGDAQNSFLDKTEFTWCGNACQDFSSLRNANFGLKGRNGILIDEVLQYSYLMTTLSAEGSYYGQCNPEVDGYIQSINPYLETSDYSFYALQNIGDSIFSTGYLRGRDLDFTYVSNAAVHNLTTKDTYYTLIGPKNVINFGLQGSVNYYWYFRTGDTLDITFEPGGLFDIQSDRIQQGIDPNTMLFDMAAGDRVNPVTLVTNSAGSALYSGSPFAEIDRQHFVFLKYQDNGTVSLDLYKFNFSTLKPDLLSSTPIYTNESLTFTFSSNRLIFASSHGTNGVLYIGDPNYTDTKASQGRILVFNWTGTSFTANGFYTTAIRNGYMGSCVGWDEVTNLIFYGSISDDILSMTSSLTAGGCSIAGARGSGAGNLFATAGGYLICWDSSTVGPRTYQLYTSSAIQRDVDTGYTYPCDILVGTNVHFPYGRTNGTRCPTLITKDAAGHYMCVTLSTTVNQHAWSSSATWTTVWCSAQRSSDEYRIMGWYNNYFYARGQDSTQLGFPSVASYGADSLAVPPRFNTWSMSCWDGTSDQEHMIFGHQSVDFNTWKIYVVDLSKTAQDHIQLGRWWFMKPLNVSGGNAILDANFYGPSSNGIWYGIDWFFKLNTDPRYWVAEGGGVFTPYNTLEDAKANAASYSLANAELRNINIDGVDIIEFYVVFWHEVWEAQTDFSANARYLYLKLNDPGLAEPIITRHFSLTELISEVYKTTTDSLTIKTPAQAQAAGVDMVASGTFIRPLYS